MLVLIGCHLLLCLTFAADMKAVEWGTRATSLQEMVLIMHVYDDDVLVLHVAAIKNLTFLVRSTIIKNVAGSMIPMHADDEGCTVKRRRPSALQFRVTLWASICLA